MIHLVEIVRDDADVDGAALRTAWETRTRDVLARHGLVEAELFGGIESLRGAPFGHLSLCGWADEDGYRAAVAAGALAGTFAARVAARITLRLAVRLGQARPAEPDHVWLVNPFEITDGEIGEALAMWDHAKDELVDRPGFIDARLFRACVAEASHGLVNLSQWRSAADFKAAIAARAYDGHRQRSTAFRMHPSLCRRLVALSDLRSAEADPRPSPRPATQPAA